MAGLLLFVAPGFCVFVLIRDSRRRGDSSPALWIATLWMMRCGSRGIDAWLGGGGTYEEGTIWDQMFLLFTALAGFGVVYRRWGRVAEVLRQNTPLIIFFAYMTVSIFWSEIPFDSSKRLFRAYGDLTMALILATEARPFEAMKEMFRRCMIILIPMSVILAKYYGALGRMHEKNWASDTWIGVATHKNTLGPLCMLAGLYCFVSLAEAKRKKRLGWLEILSTMRLETVCFAMTLYLFNGNGSDRSVTSIMAFCLGVLLYLALGRLRPAPERISRFLLTICILIGIFQVGSSLFLGESVTNLASDLRGKEGFGYLSGRGDIWAAVIKEANKRPLLGAGYGGFWNRRVLEIMRERFSWGPGQSHNGYVEVYAQLGLVGLSIFGFAVLSSVRHAIRLCFKNFELGRWRLVLLICVLFQNYSEAGFPRPTHLMWFTFLLVAVNSFPRRVVDSRKQNIYRTPSIESQARQTPGQATHAFMRFGSGLQERRYVGALLHV